MGRKRKVILVVVVVAVGLVASSRMSPDQSPDTPQDLLRTVQKARVGGLHSVQISGNDVVGWASQEVRFVLVCEGGDCKLQPDLTIHFEDLKPGSPAVKALENLLAA